MSLVCPELSYLLNPCLWAGHPLLTLIPTEPGEGLLSLTSDSRGQEPGPRQGKLVVADLYFLQQGNALLCRQGGEAELSHLGMREGRQILGASRITHIWNSKWSGVL